MDGAEADAETGAIGVVEEESQIRIDAQSFRREHPAHGERRDGAGDLFELTADRDDEAVAHGALVVASVRFRVGRIGGGGSSGLIFEGHGQHGIATQNCELGASGSLSIGKGPDSAKGMPRARYQPAALRPKRL